MKKTTITIGIGIIEHALTRFESLQLDTVELVPPACITVSIAVAIPGLPSDMHLYPEATVKFTVVEGRVKLETEDVNVIGLPVPTGWVQGIAKELVAEPEDEMNHIVDDIVDKTGLQLERICVTEECLLLDFEPLE